MLASLRLCFIEMPMLAIHSFTVLGSKERVLFIVGGQYQVRKRHATCKYYLRIDLQVQMNWPLSYRPSVSVFIVVLASLGFLAH